MAPIKYTDTEWFNREIRTCQVCKKVYDNAAAVSKCLITHKKLRCYFCFEVCKNTEDLFEHFREDHKEAGRENCVLCPYCEQTLPFKSVSTHVITLHLPDIKPDEKSEEKDSKKTKASPAKAVAVKPRRGPGRPAAVKNPASSEASDVVNKVVKASKKPAKESKSVGKVSASRAKKRKI